MGQPDVNQSAATRSEQITPGFQLLAQAVVLTLEQLRALWLSDEDAEDAESAGDLVGGRQSLVVGHEAENDHREG